MARDRRHPGGRQIHPAQADRRRRPDQRHDLEAGAGRSRPGRRCRAGAGRRHAAAGNLSLHPRRDPRAICWPRWRRRSRRFLAQAMGRAAPPACRSRPGARPSSWPPSWKRKPRCRKSAAISPRVFINRLKMGMKLQTDPTIIYDLTKGYPLGRGIRASELAAATPYNTYVIAGLPPGPICNPGKDSIAAVLNPRNQRRSLFRRHRPGRACLRRHHRGAGAQCRRLSRLRAPEPGTAGRSAARPVIASDRLENPPIAIPDAAAPKLPAPPQETRAPSQVTGPELAALVSAR